MNKNNKSGACEILDHLATQDVTYLGKPKNGEDWLPALAIHSDHQSFVVASVNYPDETLTQIAIWRSYEAKEPNNCNYVSSVFHSLRKAGFSGSHEE